MAIQREEEKLGAFTLFGHSLRILKYVRGRRWLIVLCVAGSMLEAGLDLSLPLVTRRGIDAHILPPYVRVAAEGKERAALLKKPGAVVAQAAEGSPGGVFVRSAELSPSELADLSSGKWVGKDRYYLVPERAVPGGAQGSSGSVFLSESSLEKIPVKERRQIFATERRALTNLGLLYVGLLFLNFLLGYAVTVGLNDLGQKAVQVMRGHLFRHLHTLPIKYFDENPVGRLVTRVTNDTATLSDLFTSVIATAASDVALFVGILAVLLALDPGLTARLFILAPPLIIMALWFKAVSQRIYREIRVKLAKINTYLQESVQGITVIKAFVAEARASGRFEALCTDYYQTQMRLIHIFAVFRPLIDACATSAVAVVIWYGGSQALRQELTIGTLVAFVIYLRMLFMPLQDLAEKFNIVQSSVVASERLFKILDAEPEDPGRGKVPESPCGTIQFENVSFAYEDDQPVLKEVSFEVPCGKTVALVGPTGSGKTTITALLLRFYALEPGSGRILVDGLPIEEWDLKALRSQFAFVQQDLFLFAGTLRDNIGLLREAQPDVMGRSLEISRARMVVDRLPDGLDHPLNERGTVLSQGERQLVSFARALVAQPRILVLDEATASVDSQTEAAIKQALDGLLKGRTAVVVAHRLSTVQDAHSIVVLRKGRVVEQGAHAELLARDGLYAHLYRTQFATK